jgi:Transposase DDE domain
MRVRQTTNEFRQAYAARAGIESTHAQAVRRSGLRRTRYRGLSKTHLRHVITAAAINLSRIASWADGTPLAKTRCSHFAALYFTQLEFATSVNVGFRPNRRTSPRSCPPKATRLNLVEGSA